MRKNGINENQQIYKQKQKNLDAIKYHYAIAERQKKFYNQLRTDSELLNDSILIDIDYKQKIFFGKNGPRQKTADFYKYNSCSLLGFGVYYCDKRFNMETRKTENFVNCSNFDLLSEDTSQKANDFINAFRYLRKNSIFKSIEKNKYIIFTDTAKNFRCQEVAHYYLKELADLNIQVSFNVFGEYHGKVIILKNIYILKYNAYANF